MLGVVEEHYRVEKSGEEAGEEEEYDYQEVGECSSSVAEQSHPLRDVRVNRMREINCKLQERYLIVRLQLTPDNQSNNPHRL